ncbi:MAG: HPr family phosphocarrier protein [Paracoccaceae bacterium]|nr:HPr family phosphocarrier protein [Paracoccaceae bacterium]
MKKNERRTRILKLKVINARGLHARASAKFASTVDRFRSTVEVSRGGLVVPGNSIMGLLTLAAEMGTVLSIKITGDDANEVGVALTDLVSDFFGEGQ